MDPIYVLIVFKLVHKLLRTLPVINLLVGLLVNLVNVVYASILFIRVEVLIVFVGVRQVTVSVL